MAAEYRASLDGDGFAAIWRAGTDKELKGKRVGMFLNRKPIAGERADPFA
jgi:hypothetical protein